MPNIPTGELARYRATARARAIQREQELLAYRELAWSVARAAAALLKTSYDVERVVLFRGEDLSERLQQRIQTEGIAL